MFHGKNQWVSNKNLTVRSENLMDTDIGNWKHETDMKLSVCMHWTPETGKCMHRVGPRETLDRMSFFLIIEAMRNCFNCHQINVQKWELN